MVSAGPRPSAGREIARADRLYHGADAPDLDTFLDLLDGVKPTERLLLGDIGPVIGTHAGPRAIGVAWLPTSV